MRPTIIHRAVTLAALLALVTSAAAVADTVGADGDTVTPGIQPSAWLGEVAPGAVLELDVPFTLVCKYPSHVAAGSTISVIPDTYVVAAGGALTATRGTIGPVPSDWPAAGTSCPATGVPSLVSSTPSHVTITAPAAPGVGYEYTVLYVRDPEDGLSSMTSVTFTLDVVAADPADTTPPVLAGVPTGFDVETEDPAGAVVTWPAPTAVDDTDAAPVVACDPASGSLFAVGTTTVTCTATDAAGNRAAATFDVTVRLRVPVMEARWAPPLRDDSPLLVGPQGRVVPVVLTLLVDGQPWTPDSGAAPSLRLDSMSGCGASATATVMATTTVGPMRWQEGRWTRSLDLHELAPGCWQLTAVVGGHDAGSVSLDVTGGPRGLEMSAITSSRNR